MSRSRRSRPNKKKMRERVQHSYDHRGQSGKFADIFTEELSLWKPGVGPHEFMPIPYLYEGNENSPFRKNEHINQPFSDEELEKGDCYDYKLTVFVHNNIGVNEDSFLCLRTVGETCPICEHRAELEKDDPDFYEKEIKKLWPSKRALYNVVVLDSDKDIEEGVQVYDAPHPSIEDALSETAKKRDRRTGEIEHRDYTIPEEGWNACFERVGTGIGTDYKQVEILERQKSQDFSESEIDEFYEDAICFEDVIEIKTYEELYEIFHGVKFEDRKEVDRSNRDRGRRRERDSDDKPKRRGRGKGKSDKDKKDTGRRGRGRSSDKESDKPKCFGLECNMRDECETCPEDTFDDCLDAFEDAKKEKEGSRRRGRSSRR